MQNTTHSGRTQRRYSAAGRRIASICGERIARCTLELGGKSAAVILDDMDIATAGHRGRLHPGHRWRPAEGPDRGWYVEPTVFGHVDNSSVIVQEEIFGPVLSVIPARDEQDAIAIANDTIYGLNASVLTNDVNRARQVAGQLRSGTVGHTAFRTDFSVAFGGFKLVRHRPGGRSRGTAALPGGPRPSSSKAGPPATRAPRCNGTVTEHHTSLPSQGYSSRGRSYTTWMPRSCRWNSMEAAFTPYVLVPTVLELLKSVFGG